MTATILPLSRPLRRKAKVQPKAKDASPWMTRNEAGEYLRLSTDTIDRRLTPYDRGEQVGMIRFKFIPCGERRQLRLVRSDVLAILPEP